MEKSVKSRLAALEQEFEDNIVYEDLTGLYIEVLGEEHPVTQNFIQMTTDGSLERAIREQRKSERKKW